MAQWGNVDNAANSVLWAVAGFNKPANSTNQTAFFGNTTADAYITGETVGLFGADTTETGVTNGSILAFQVVFPGSGYLANTTVTVSGNGTANATAFANGRISAVTVIASGNNYSAKPVVTIAAPSAQTFNANSAITNATDFIAVSPNPFINNDIVTYLVAAGNTALTNLSNNTTYFVVAANSTGLSLSNTVKGTAIDLTKGLTETGHSLTGQTATAEAVLARAHGSFHAGWVVRTVGSGGRAGRVTYETLVAMGSMTGDAEDVILKDS
jgi:hypothetical protein